MVQTCASGAISSKALKTGTEEATNGVCAVSIHITVISAPDTLIDICQEGECTNQRPTVIQVAICIQDVLCQRVPTPIRVIKSKTDFA